MCHLIIFWKILKKKNFHIKKPDTAKEHAVQMRNSSYVMLEGNKYVVFRSY